MSQCSEAVQSTLAVIDLSAFLANPSSAESIASCKQLSQSLKATGIVILRDERVSTDDQAAFLDMMECACSRNKRLSPASGRLVLTCRA